MCRTVSLYNLLHLVHKTKRTRKNAFFSLTLCGLEPSTKLNINPGKPKCVIKTETLLHLRRFGFNWNNTSISSHAAQCFLLFLVGQLGARMVHELGIQDFVSYEIAVG